MSRIFEELVRKREFRKGELKPKFEDSIDPFLMPDMEKAIKRLVQAKERGEKVLIYGDYDVDGVTASTLMYDALELAGVQVARVMLPNRFTDGYGMSHKVVEESRRLGVKLVVTVDCGSRNHEIIEELGSLGIETIVTDHHECAEILPKAVAVVNPKRKEFAAEAGSRGGKAKACAEDDEPGTGSVDELRELAGVGVAFKVAQAMAARGMIPAGQEKWLLDLVLIGTICDSMKLRGENRRLVKYGALVLEKTRRRGLKELMRLVGVKKFSSDAIGFQIGPRLNAAGRMDTAEKALRLLMAKNAPEAAKLALELENLNKARREQQLAAVGEIEKQGVGKSPVIVVKGDWHEGIIGIVAGKLVEQYHKPAFVFCGARKSCLEGGFPENLEGSEGASSDELVLKGSGRSFGGFNLAEALEACKEEILGGGGHAEACGVKLSPEKFEEFSRAVNDYYNRLKLCNQEKCFMASEDFSVDDFKDLNLELLDELKELEPYGEGNPEPVFLLPGVRVIEADKLGDKGQHLRLLVWDKSGKGLKLMSFYAPEEYLKLRGGETVNIWAHLKQNEFRGTRSVEGEIVRMEI